MRRHAVVWRLTVIRGKLRAFCGNAPDDCSGCQIMLASLHHAVRSDAPWRRGTPGKARVPETRGCGLPGLRPSTAVAQGNMRVGATPVPNGTCQCGRSAARGTYRPLTGLGRDRVGATVRE